MPTGLPLIGLEFVGEVAGRDRIPSPCVLCVPMGVVPECIVDSNEETEAPPGAAGMLFRFADIVTSRCNGSPVLCCCCRSTSSNTCGSGPGLAKAAPTRLAFPE